MHNVPIPVNDSKSRGWQHDFPEKSAGGCSSCDIIALWPELTQSIVFTKRCAKDASLAMQNFSAIRPAVRRPFQKNSWGDCTPPPLHWRGLNVNLSVSGSQDLCKNVCTSMFTMPKLTLEHFLNDPNWTNFENFENTEIARNSMKNGLFQHSKHQNSGIFQDIYLKFCTHIYLTGFFDMYSVFWKCKKIPHFLKIMLFWLFLKIFQKFRIWDSSLMEMFIFNLLLKTNCFIF